MTTPSWLTQARQQVASTFLDTAVIKRKVAIPDGMGGTTETWTDVDVVVCRIHVGGGGSTQYAGRIMEQETGVVRVTLPYGTVLSTADRLYVNSSILLEITGIDAPKTFATAIVCSCKVSLT